MRDLEFLPPWYAVVRRRRLLTIIQAWATAGLLLVLLIWTGVSRFHVLMSRNDLGGLKREMARTQQDLDHLDSLNQLKRRWTEQGEVLAKLGVSVESTRLMNLLAQNTPASVALTDLSLQTEEKIGQPQTIAAARSMKEPTIDRKLLVHVKGVAPSGAEVADLMGKLATVSFLQDVALSSSTESEQAGRVVRAFEVTFAMDLNVNN